MPDISSVFCVRKEMKRSAYVVKFLFLSILLALGFIMSSSYVAADILPASIVTIQNGNQIIVNVTYREPVCLSNVTLKNGAATSWTIPRSQIQQICHNCK